jgi:3-hydroxyisobutyrate dehydrogenase
VDNESKTHWTDRERHPTVAVLGTGTMGSATARRLLSAGMAVRAWDREPRAALGLAEAGATAFDDPQDAVSAAPIVLTWLPTSAAVSEVMLGREALETMALGAVWAQMGTIGAEATESLAAEVASHRPDVRFVDAPVSGSRHPAESGELLVLASGPEAARPIVEPVFDVLSRRTLWLGKAGTGSRLKLVLNTWLAFEVEAAAEAAAVATRLGISLDVLATAADGNPLASPLALSKLDKIEKADLSPDFSLEWALKDLELMRASVDAAQAPIAAAIADRWRLLVEQGYGGLDVSAARLGLGEDGSPD